MSKYEDANQIADRLETHDSKDMIVFKASAMLREQTKEIEVLNQSYKLLFKHRIEQEKEIKDLRQIVEGTIKQAFYEDDYHKATVKIELLKANLRDVAEQLRSGVSKVQQKTMARVIEQTLEESK